MGVFKMGTFQSNQENFKRQIHSILSFIFFFLVPFNQTYSQTITVAVLEFDGANITRDEIGILADRLSSEIFKLGEYTVVERSAMDEILSEQGFQQSGCTSTDCAVEVGALLGVQKMVTGSIGKIGKLYTITAKSIDVETGKIDNQISLDVSGTIEILLTETMSKVSTQLFSVKSEEANSKTKTLLSSNLPVEKKNSSRKLIYAAGATLAAGGIAYFLTGLSSEEEQTGSVSVSIEIPN